MIIFSEWAGKRSQLDEWPNEVASATRSAGLWDRQSNRPIKPGPSCRQPFPMCSSCGPLVEVDAPGVCLRHDTLDNDPGSSALPVQLRVGPGSGDDGPLAGANYGAVRL
jgi:hypothetical protein